MSSPAPWLDARGRIEASGLIAADLIQWPNEPFVEPVNPRVMWINVTMTGDTLEPIELGPARTWREEGGLAIDIYTPAGAGSLDARTLGKALVNLFRNVPTSAIVYTRASIGDGQAEDIDGVWWRFTVSVAYRYGDIVS